MKTEITLIRHGETELNHKKILQGHLDSKLSPKGHSQALNLKKLIDASTFDRIISSDLSRALKTTEILTLGSHIKIKIEPLLRERNFGIFQGYSKTEIKYTFPEEYKSFKSDYVNYKIPQGESLQDFYTRIISYFNKLTNTIKDDKILIICHGGVIRMLYSHTLNMELQEGNKFPVYNCGQYSFIKRSDKWQYIDQNPIKGLQNTLISHSKAM